MRPAASSGPATSTSRATRGWPSTRSCMSGRTFLQAPRWCTPNRSGFLHEAADLVQQVFVENIDDRQGGEDRRADADGEISGGGSEVKKNFIVPGPGKYCLLTRKAL